MKILVTNHWLKKMGGSETFTYTLIGELVRCGHEVDVYSKLAGNVAVRIYKDFKVKARETTGKLPYDIVLASHKTCVETVRSIYDGLIIQTCHGTTPKLEQPYLGIPGHVAISEEVQSYLFNRYDLESVVIYNGIDCNRFRPIKTLNPKIKKVLSLSHSESLNKKLTKYFHAKGISFLSHSKYMNPVWHIQEEMNKVDLVISLGRGVYEAMACGRAVLVLDHRPYQDMLGDGILTEYNFFDMIKFNCSGRAYRRKDLSEILDESLEIYNPLMGIRNRELALEYLNIENQVNKYLQYYEQIK